MSGEQLSGFQQLPRRAVTNGSRKFNQLRTAFLLKLAFRSMTPTPASRTNCGCVSLRSAYVFDVFDVFNVRAARLAALTSSTPTFSVFWLSAAYTIQLLERQALKLLQFCRPRRGEPDGHRVPHSQRFRAGA